MIWAPWAAASRAASSCLSIIASLLPAQSVWSSAALTMLGIGTPGDSIQWLGAAEWTPPD